MKQKNRLANSTSPYLLQHAKNPVDWFPWCDEAFEKAKREDKPVFLSIGYSTCHWCHVMAHESFEDEEIARILNENFVAIKVDREERPDIDSIYMQVCLAFTGNGGWPTSIFMTPEQKPFYAGTYFPKNARYGMIGFRELLITISEKWKTDKEDLLKTADKIISHLNRNIPSKGDISDGLIDLAYKSLKKDFDEKYGGFGNAPKFPTPHNLLFLLDYYEKSNEKFALDMAEKTLLQMYKGGMFDHIGYGFSRYSTDRYFFVPHFEKMLYDNALLIMAYSRAYDITKKEIYRSVAEKTAKYVLREMKAENGGFYSAQDADSNGVEGLYYVFSFDEVVDVLGERGKDFNVCYGITEEGNFEGKNIPNLLQCSDLGVNFDDSIDKLYQYRKNRASLHLDDKQLMAWNSLMVAAFTFLYRVTQNKHYIKTAEAAARFLDKNMCDGDELYVSYRNGIRSGVGYLDDYAYYIFSLINLYDSTLEQKYLDRARNFCDIAIADFFDKQNGGFFLYGERNEQLILRPKETHDGAMPSGNSVMTYNLVRLSELTENNFYIEKAREQLGFMSAQAKGYPAGYTFFMLALLEYQKPNEVIVCVVKDDIDIEKIKGKTRFGSNIIITRPTDEYKLLNDRMTFYICKNHSCYPPTNDITKVLQ